MACFNVTTPASLKEYPLIDVDGVLFDADTTIKAFQELNSAAIGTQLKKDILDLIAALYIEFIELPAEAEFEQGSPIEQLERQQQEIDRLKRELEEYKREETESKS